MKCRRGNPFSPINPNLPFHAFQLLDDFLKIGGQIRENQHGPSVPGMAEAQRTRVEALAVLAKFRFFVSVDRVAQDGVTDVGHVDPDLMGPACFQLSGCGYSPGSV